MAEDIQLLRQYADSRADTAFAALVERNISFVYAAALRQLGGATQRAEDVTQTVFIQLARQAPTLAQRDDIVGWLYTATHYTAASLKRSEARRQRREQEAQAMHELLTESSDQADWTRLRPVLDDALLELSERDRVAVLHRFFKNEGFAEIGQRLEITEDAARMRVERALDKLHALLAKRGITSTTAALSAAFANEALVAAPAGLAASVTGTALSTTTVVGAGSLAAAWYFMSTAKVTLSLAAAGAVATGLVVYQAQQADALATEIGVLQREQTTTRARIGALTSELKAAEQEQDERSAALERIRTESIAAAAKARQAALAAEARKKQETALQEFLGRDPELLKLRYEAAAANYRALNAWRPGMTPEKIEAEARKSAESAEQNDARQLIGMEADAPARGPNFDARSVARSFANRQYYLGEPYTREHETRLVAILSKAQISQDPKLSQYAKFDWDRVVAEATTSFSPAQLQIMRGWEAWGREAVLFAEAAKEASNAP